ALELGAHHEGVGGVRVAHPGLRARDDVSRALLRRARLVGRAPLTAVGLEIGEREELLSRDERLEEGLLLGASALGDGEAREDVLEEGLRHELAPDRLEHERHLEEATTEAADVLREGEAEPAELRHLAVEREVE